MAALAKSGQRTHSGGVWQPTVAEQAAAHPELQLELRPGALGAEPEVVRALADAAVRALQEAGSTNDESSTS